MKVLVVKLHDTEESNDPVHVTVYGGRNQAEAEHKAFLEMAPDFADDSSEEGGYWGFTVDHYRNWSQVVETVNERGIYTRIYSHWVDVK